MIVRIQKQVLVIFFSDSFTFCRTFFWRTRSWGFISRWRSWNRFWRFKRRNEGTTNSPGLVYFAEHSLRVTYFSGFCPKSRQVQFSKLYRLKMELSNFKMSSEVQITWLFANYFLLVQFSDHDHHLKSKLEKVRISNGSIFHKLHTHLYISWHLTKESKSIRS